MTNFTLERTGQAPLKFRGERIAEAGDRLFRQIEQNRWHELAVYRAENGRYVLCVTYRTLWQGEADHDLVIDCTDAAAVRAQLAEHDPTARVVGYPPGDHFAEKQRRLLAHIRAMYDAAVSALLAGDEFVEALE